MTNSVDPDVYVNSADPDETAHNEPSHQDLHCLQRKKKNSLISGTEKVKVST